MYQIFDFQNLAEYLRNRLSSQTIDSKPDIYLKSNLQSVFISNNGLSVRKYRPSQTFLFVKEYRFSE